MSQPELGDCPHCDETILVVPYLALGAEKPYLLALQREPVEAFVLGEGNPEPVTVYVRHRPTCAGMDTLDVGATELAAKAGEVTPEQGGER